MPTTRGRTRASKETSDTKENSQKTQSSELPAPVANKGSKEDAKNKAKVTSNSKVKRSVKTELQSENSVSRKRPRSSTKSKDDDTKPLNNKKAKSSKNVTEPAAATSGEREWVHLLMKSEPESFSIDSLEQCKEPEPWSGVRNYVARNNMMTMKKGDLAFFYHSNCKTPGIVGIMEIVGEAVPDITALDSKSQYYDATASVEKPKWFNVHVELREKFTDPDKTSLSALRALSGSGEPLEQMQLFKQSRLSVGRVRREEWNYIVELAGYPQYKVKI